MRENDRFTQSSDALISKRKKKTKNNDPGYITEYCSLCAIEIKCYLFRPPVKNKINIRCKKKLHLLSFTTIMFTYIMMGYDSDR